VTIVQVGRGNGGGGDGGSDLLRLEPPPDLKPAPSPLSDTSTTLQSDNNDTLTGGKKCATLLYLLSKVTNTFIPFSFHVRKFF